MTFPGTHEAAYRPHMDVSALGWIAIAALSRSSRHSQP